MYLRALQKDSLKNVGAVERYLLLRLMLECKINRTVEGSSRDLAARFHVSHQAATRLFRILEKEGVMRSQALTFGRPGRPCINWSLCENFFEKLFCPSDQHLYQLGRVEELLKAPLYRKTQSSSFLRAQAMLVLIALLLNADKFGVVRNQGLSDLSSLTGLKKNRIPLQLDKLLEYEYILTFFPGTISTHFFGKVNTIYFLNLRHSRYKELSREGKTLIFLLENGIWIPVTSLIEGSFAHGNSKFEQNNIFLSWIGEWKGYPRFWPSPEDLDLIRPLLKNRRDRVLIELELENQISVLLSKYWNELMTARDLLARDQVQLHKIHDALFPSSFCCKQNEEGKENYEKGKSLLSSLLLNCSILLARDIQRLLAMHEITQCSQYQIIPYLSGERGGMWSDLVHSPGEQRFSCSLEINDVLPQPQPQPRYLLYRKDKAGKFFFEKADNLDSLTLEQQYSFGLKARPRISKVDKMNS